MELQKVKITKKYFPVTVIGYGYQISLGRLRLRLQNFFRAVTVTVVKFFSTGYGYGSGYKIFFGRLRLRLLILRIFRL